MMKRPLLGLPYPTKRSSKGPEGFPREAVRPADAQRQGQRLGPKFEKLSKVLPDPCQLAELRRDPAAIAPERALVFEIASELVDFDRALHHVPGLEFLGEDQDEVESDEDFFIQDKPEKAILRRLYFTMPNIRALGEIVNLWKRYQEGEELHRGQKEWKKVFGYLANIRPWGPQDRITAEVREDWREHLRKPSKDPISMQVEFWYRRESTLRETVHQKFQKMVWKADGQILDRATIHDIRYDAALLQVQPGYIQRILDNPDIGLAAFDGVMVLRPQSLVIDPQEIDFDEGEDVAGAVAPDLFQEPRAALLDGLPMAQHTKLKNRLSIEDPDDYESKYGLASEQVHGTSMASLIVHGDLNSQAPHAPVRSRLYVRPVMFPQQAGFDDQRQESMPLNRLAIDVVWRSFIRMFAGEGDAAPTAPNVKVVNLSLGDLNRRFSGILSPWARLIDHLSWKYGVLILISAGNIRDPIPLDDVKTWDDFETAPPEEREAILLGAILRQKSRRSLLAPSEGLNALTIGACHADLTEPNGAGVLAIDPYETESLPNPSSALGLGYLRGVKPEILLPGGREHIRTTCTHAPISVRPVDTSGMFFGIGAAAPPGSGGELTKKSNFFGTSVATALATHSALKIIESLEDIPGEPPHPNVNETFHAVLAKTLLVHAAKWDKGSAKKIAKISEKAGNEHWEHQREDAARFLGFGTVDLNKVLDCTEYRATMIGGDTIHAKEEHEFRIPLPPQLESLAGFRAVTATAGWFTPLNIDHRMYRMAKLEIEPGSDSDKELSLGVSNSKQQPSHHAFGKGTVYHRRWEGDKAKAFVDGGALVLKVACKPAAGKLDAGIRYGLAITLEVGEDVAVPVYEEVRERLRQHIGVPVRT